MTRGLLLAALAMWLGGCTLKMPLVSHAHMGHTLTAWHDTPDQRGLFVVAVQETDTALAEAALARAKAADASLARLHALNVLHALNPDRQPFGPGLSYGALRALEGAIDHLEFAASSEDASDNMIASVADIAELGDRLQADLSNALGAAVEMQHAAAADLPRIAARLHVALHRARHADNGAASVAQIDAAIRAMLERETDPPYQPVPRRYVLGLIRLPNGAWAYRLPQGHAGHRGSSYRY